MMNFFNMVCTGFVLAGFCDPNIADKTVPISCADTECCDRKVAMYDLRKGTYTTQPEGIQLTTPLQDLMYGNKECGFSGLLKVSFESVTEKPYNICMSTPWWGRRMLKLEMFFHPFDRNGRLFTIGDSDSNNGEGGDGYSQAYDAEMDGNFPNVSIYNNDVCFHEGYPRKLGQYQNALDLSVPSMTVYVANQFTRVKYGQHEDRPLCSKCLFGLNNYPDTESRGQPNNDIYVSFNSVVTGGTYRMGYGLCSVKASWVCPESQ